MPPTQQSKPAERVYHCTYYKCGSQWIRDLLTDPDIAQYSGCQLSVSGVEVSSSAWPIIGSKAIASPLYTVGDGHWRDRPDPRPEDRAIVVLRDPRDMVVSLVFSMNYSHTPDGVNRLLRRPVRNATRGDRIQLGMHMVSLWVAYMVSWTKSSYPDVFVTRYETMLQDELAEFGAMLRFLGWPVPPHVVAEVVARNSFQTTAGRKRGVENEFSHRRKGVAGDWRNNFTQQLGRLFEESFPGLLVDLGYEGNGDWWKDLPETIAEHVNDINAEMKRLLKTLEEYETELKVVRAAAEERLKMINTLTKNYNEMLQSRDLFEKAANDRLAVIQALTSQHEALRRKLEQQAMSGAAK